MMSGFAGSEVGLRHPLISLRLSLYQARHPTQMRPSDFPMTIGAANRNSKQIWLQTVRNSNRAHDRVHRFAANGQARRSRRTGHRSPRTETVAAVMCRLRWANGYYL